MPAAQSITLIKIAENYNQYLGYFYCTSSAAITLKVIEFIYSALLKTGGHLSRYRSRDTVFRHKSIRLGDK